MNKHLTNFTGTEVGYYFICRKKLWWFHHGIQMETESDRVKLGKVVHENSYERKKKEISIDNKIVLDWQSDGVIHEVKLSDSQYGRSARISTALLYFLSQTKRR